MSIKEGIEKDLLFYCSEGTFKKSLIIQYRPFFFKGLIMLYMPLDLLSILLILKQKWIIIIYKNC